jgi:hypothetical protein
MDTSSIGLEVALPLYVMTASLKGSLSETSWWLFLHQCNDVSPTYRPIVWRVNVFSRFHAGAPTDYDEWTRADHPESESWAYKSFQRYFLKFEKYTPSPLFPLVDASLRNSKGPLHGQHSPEWYCAIDNLPRSRILWLFL